MAERDEKIAEDLLRYSFSLAFGMALALSAVAAGGGGSEHLPVFTDTTEASGVRFHNENSATPEKYLIETMTGGVAMIDYDNDGWPDLFFVNGARFIPGRKTASRLIRAIRVIGTACIAITTTAHLPT